MFIRGETVSAHSARPRKIPGWIVLVRETFSVNKQVCRKQTIEIALRGFLSVAFHPKKLKIIRMILELVRGKKFNGEQ